MLCVCLAAFLGGPAQAAKMPKIEAARPTVIVGMPVHFPPHYGLDAAGQPKGFAIDVIKALATDAGIKLSYRIFASPAALDAA